MFETAPISTWAGAHYHRPHHLCRQLHPSHHHQMVGEEEEDETGGRAQLIWRSLHSFERRGAMFCQHQVVRLSLVNAHCAAHYSMHTKYAVQCTLCTLVNAHCAHYSMQTVHIIQCTVYTLFNAQCEHYSMHSVNTIQCTLHSVHNALHCTGPCRTAIFNALRRDHSVKLEGTALQMAALSNAPQDCTLI